MVFSLFIIEMNNNDKVNWSAYMCSQNLSSLLADPNRGKQKDFFTRTWGEVFVDTTAVLPSPRLPEITNAYFVPYFKKLLKRYRKLKDRKPTTQAQLDPLHAFFPQLASRETAQLLKPETSPIPRIFFTQNFTLANAETFREAFGVDTETIPAKMVQDKFSHYLDLVEVGLAHQISKKSSAFFSAVSTQDKVSEKVSKSLLCVQEIKLNLKQVRKNKVEMPLAIIKLSKKKSNLIHLYQKLQLMATVHQAQRAIQSLLGNSDYVGALDLIATTQEVLRQDLQGLVSFRHLDSQLVEIRNVIEKMLRAELERNLSVDLNRPIDQMVNFIDKPLLVSIILGHLRLGKVAPIVAVLAKEISTAMTTVCKQILIEVVSESDSKSDSLVGSNSIHLAIPQLPTDLWVKMISHLGQRLVKLLQHIREVILLFQGCGDSAVGALNDGRNECELPLTFLPDSEDPLISTQIFAIFTTELAVQLEKTTTTADENFVGILRNRKTWLIKSEFFLTIEAVKEFVSELDKFFNSLSRLSAASPKSFRYASTAEMKTQSTEFFRTFHLKQTEIVSRALERERWKVTAEEKMKRFWHTTNLQHLIEKARRVTFDHNNHENLLNVVPSSPPPPIDLNSNQEDEKVGQKEFFKPTSLPNTSQPQSQQIINSPSPETEIRTAEIFFVLLSVISEYCNLLKITNNAEVVLGLVDILRGANSRIAGLILGAGAVELKMVKSITVASLAVVVRGLCLISGLGPQIKEFSKEALPNKNHHLLKHVDIVQLEISRHSEDVEYKMVNILSELIGQELENWEAKPPVPSISINNISKSIFRFREAIGPVLTHKQISELFMRVDKVFRSKLKERIGILGIAKDGGPRHGVVTSEMMHYTENLRKLNVLPANVISNIGLTQELWPK